MMKSRWWIMMLCCCFLHADTIVMRDGSRIHGKLEKITEKQVKFKTDFAGVLKISRDKIHSLKTNENCYYVWKKDIGVHLPPIQNTAVDLDGAALEKIASLWHDGQDNPYAPKKRKWSGNCFIDISGKEGNTDKFSRNIGIAFFNKGQYDMLKLYLSTCYSEENDVKSDDDMTLGVDYEYTRNHHSWYSRIEYEEDEMSNLEHRYKGATGYGFYVWKNRQSLLRLRIGLDFTRESWDGKADEQNDIGLDSSLLFRYNFRKYGKWRTELTYNPVFDDWFDDYRLLHESYWELPLRLKIALALRLGISHEYYGLTIGDVRHCDTTYFARLVYKW